MTDMILVYVTCESVEQAKDIAKQLMDKRLCACVNIFPHMYSMVFWPPKTGEVEQGNEVVLIIKTTESKYAEVESEVKQIHSYELPCIFAIPVAHVFQPYEEWLKGEVEV